MSGTLQHLFRFDVRPNESMIGRGTDVLYETSLLGVITRPEHFRVQQEEVRRRENVIDLLGILLILVGETCRVELRSGTAL